MTLPFPLGVAFPLILLPRLDGLPVPSAAALALLLALGCGDPRSRFSSMGGSTGPRSFVGDRPGGWTGVMGLVD